MAEFGSFGKGLAIQREITQTANINKAKARATAENERRDDARAVGTSLLENLQTGREQAIEVVDGMNAGLVEQAKLGELDPQVVADVKRNQLLTLANYATTLDELRVAAAQDPNVDERMLAAMPSGTEFLRRQEARLEQQIVAGMASAPGPKGRAAAMEVIAKAEAILGRPATPDERGQLAGLKFDPKLKTFYMPDGTWEMADYSTGEGREMARDIIARGGIETPRSVVAEDSGAFGTPTAFENFIDLTTQTMNLIDEVDNLRISVRSNDKLTTGLTATTVGFLTRTASQVDQAMRVLRDQEVDSSIMRNGELQIGGLDFKRINNPALRRAAQQSDSFKFNLTGLAFMLARVYDPNDRLSAQEVQFQLERLGDGNLVTVDAILKQVERGVLLRFRNNMEVRSATNPDFEDEVKIPSRLQDRLDRLGPGAAPVPENETPDNLPKPVGTLLQSVDEGGDPNSPEMIQKASKLSQEEFVRYIEELRKRGVQL